MNLKDISWQVSEPEYRADKALSYSTIARYQREGFNGLKNLFSKQDSPSLLFGSVVDVLITEPEVFNDIYDIRTLPTATESLDAIARVLVDRFPEYRRIDEIPDEILARIGEEMNYYANKRYEQTRIKYIKSGCKPLYDALKDTDGRIIIPRSLYEEAKACALELKVNEDTSRFFAQNNPFDNYQRFYQLKFKGEYEGIPIRIMADLIIQDDKNKLIIPCDLKTSSKPENEFYKSYVEWRYMYQSAMYTYVIEQNIKKHKEFKGYKILPYHFIVINKNTKSPMVWTDDLSVNTTKEEDFKVGENFVIPHWTKTLKELDGYLKEDNTPRYPHWKKETNSIWEKLNK